MNAKVKTKKGTAVIHFTKDGDDYFFSNYNFIYDAVKGYFNDWLINYAPKEMYEMYTGSFEEMHGGSYCDWEGAVEMGIEAVVEYCWNNKKSITTKDFYKIDLDGLFQC